jgi:two-component system, OmpR family, response regulator RegX3
VTSILIIEDEKPMADAIRYSLEAEGFEVEIATDGEQGLRRFDEGRYDLVVLDLMLPGMDGLEICKRMRLAGSTPVIMLTAKDSEMDRVLGLELGADDYITKPFSMRELTARVRAVMRRFQASEAARAHKVLESGDVSLDVERHEVTARGRVVDVALTEFRLLELFLDNSGRVLSREYLISAGWGGEFYAQNKALDVHIRRLRERLEEDPSNPLRIITVRGVGYRFEPHQAASGD